MKNLLIALAILQSSVTFSQTQHVLKILNDELRKEVLAQKEDPENYHGRPFEVVKNYTIKDSIITMTAVKVDSVSFEITEEYLVQTEVKLLSIEIKKKNYYSDDYYTEKQEVNLQDIKFVIKDINVIFETEPDAVKITRTEDNGEQSFITSDMFFLHLSYDKHNEHLADMLIDAFSKADYTIKKGSWYD